MDEQDNVTPPKRKGGRPKGLGKGGPRIGGNPKLSLPRDPSKLPPQLIPHLFKPGNPGGPGRELGSKNKMTIAALEWAKDFLNQSEEYRIARERRLIDGKAPLLEKYLFERIAGKPKEHVEISTTGPLFNMEGDGPKED